MHFKLASGLFMTQLCLVLWSARYCNCLQSSRAPQNPATDNESSSPPPAKSAYVKAINARGYMSSGNSSSQSKSYIQKCARKSMVLARQTIVKELEYINQFNTIWFSDMDRDELVEEQKQSLSNIIMSGGANQLFINGRPLLEVEASYLRPLSTHNLPASLLDNQAITALLAQQSTSTTSNGAHVISIKLIRRFPDRCYLHSEKSQYTYVVGLALGPIEHNLDVIYNLDRNLSVTQPIDWRYAHVKIIIPRMNYEITLKQAADTRLDAQAGCPLDVADVTYLSGSNGRPPQLAIVAAGLAPSNQTVIQLERLFNDYTRPAISNRLRQVLKFYLNSKTVPLSRSAS